MDEPAAWRALAAHFSELAALEGGGKLYATWSPLSWGQDDPWRIGGIEDPYVQDRFRALAERAAVLLGQSPGPSSVFHWLEVLKEESRHHEPIRHFRTKADGTEESEETGSIRSVCLASAEHCYRLETQAIAKERGKWVTVEESAGLAPSRSSVSDEARKRIIEAIAGPEIRAQQEFRYKKRLKELEQADQGERLRSSIPVADKTNAIQETSH